MKTIKTITLLVAMAFGTMTYAQNVTLGLTGGYNTTTFETLNFDNTYNGWNASFTSIWSAQSNWGIGADLVYSRIGGTYMQFSEPRGENLNYRVQSDFIRVTPKFHYFFGDLDDNLRPTLFVGPSLGIFARAAELSNNVDWRNDFNPIELAALVGGGVNYQIVSGFWLHANVNYISGITNLNADPSTDPNDLRTNSLGVNVGLAYSLNKINNAIK